MAQNSNAATGFGFEDEPEDNEYVPKLSELEEEYMKKAMIRQKEGIVKPQVVAGREFKGTAFISKPEKIIFKDFTVGLSHTQTILFTNVSFSFNSFKLLPLEDKIKDFFHIQYTPSGRMSAGLSTTITITFTPQLNQDINTVFPILSETGRIDIPLICTCKKALIEVEEEEINFGDVIFGEQNTQYLKIKNTGALPTKIYVKSPDGRTVPFVTLEDIKQKKKFQEDEKKEQAEAARKAEEAAIAEVKRLEEEEAEGEEKKEEVPSPKQGLSAKKKSVGFMEVTDRTTSRLTGGRESSLMGETADRDEITEVGDLLEEEEGEQVLTEAEIFDEFIAQVSFKRTTQIEGYSQTRIQFTYIPYKLSDIEQNFTLFFENQDYTKPIPIVVKGRCVDVPIYVEKPEYNMNVLVYEQFYREKIVLQNRGQSAMKIQLFFPRDFKPYLEFNPTLGYIQANGSFEIWAKFKPDRTILTACQRFLVKQNEEPPKDEYEEFTMRVPIKVTGANQVLPVKFSLLCVFTVNSVTFDPPQLDFGSVFNASASRCAVNITNHSLLPQQFSFVRLPKEIRVTTDNGTGTILPQETYKLQLEYRPSVAQVYEETNLFVRFITGKVCVRELKLPYTCNVVKCPISCDKSKIEFPCLPETEFSEVVLQISNKSQKNYTIEVVPPNPKVSGLIVNPLVKPLPAGRNTLVSVKYNSLFRDLNYHTYNDVFKPKIPSPKNTGLVVGSKNKKLEERLKKEREERSASTLANDPKGAKGKAAPPAAKKEEKKVVEKPVKKTPQQIEEEEAEEEKKKREAEEAERRRLQALEDAFDRDGELKALGGRVFNFETDNPNKRTQHYEWLIPVYFRLADGEQSGSHTADIKSLFLEARTTTVQRILHPNTDVLEFGEVPVAFKKTQEILVKNYGLMDETLRLESLTPFGGFSVLNAMRTIRPGETKPIVIQFEPLAQQIYEERVVMFSNHTMVSVNLKGTGVRPEVKIVPDTGLLDFGNVLVGEWVEKTFEIENVSSFPVNFDLVSKVSGVENQKKQVPFTLIPARGSIKANSTYEVKIIFQPDHVSNHFFNVLLIDIPNQVNAKSVYLRGHAYTRQTIIREFAPFVWRPLKELEKNYEQPLVIKNESGAVAKKQTILLEYLRDDDAIKQTENPFLAEQNRVRKVLIGNCRLMDIKMEKGGNFEMTPKKEDKYFECDQTKGTVAGGQEVQVKFVFKPPSIDPLLQDIGALKGLGQWIESVWECKLTGGYVEPGTPDAQSIDIVLRSYVEQI